MMACDGLEGDGDNEWCSEALSSRYRYPCRSFKQQCSLRHELSRVL